MRKAIIFIILRIDARLYHTLAQGVTNLAESINSTMKKILGLDLGTNSIGWALVNEAENNDEKSEIIRLGVRVNPLTVDEQQNFDKGRPITTNAERTHKRSMRRNLQRYKLRRKALLNILKSANWIDDETIINEYGNYSTFQTLHLRAKAADEEITLEEFARVLINLNKKRGYKSSRKVKSTEDGTIVDGINIAQMLYENDITPGQYVYGLMKNDKFVIPDFYHSDLQTEFDRIWEYQSLFYPTILTKTLKETLCGKNKAETWKACQKPFNIAGIKRDFKGKELKKQNYLWRDMALKGQMGLEELACVLQEINGDIKNSSGYLGSISDRSKELKFGKITVGQYQMAQLEKNPNHSLKNQVFFRQDYMDEFEKIWETQSRYHKELTAELKKTIRDIVIFYQRPPKSQKGLISLCEFEHREIKITTPDGKEKTKTIGLKVCPRSSPLFQEFKIWQILNNIKANGQPLSAEQKDELFNELNIKGKLTDKEVIKLLFNSDKDIHLNFKDIEGNNTQEVLFNAYSKIIENSGHDAIEFKKMSGPAIVEYVKLIFNVLGFKTDFLTLNALSEDIENEPLFKLWHLLYSFEGDKSLSGNQKLVEKISALTGMDENSAKILTSVTFVSDYGSLCSKAIRNILTYLKEGNEYSLACEYAGYRHSAKSLTREEIQNKVYKNALTILPKNSLRNPVVEKILNQMINVVNEIIETYGKPDEIRIELARELKKSAKEREEMTSALSKATIEQDKIRKILESEFGIANPSRNDIIRYRLYRELEKNGFRTLYSNTYIPQEKLFSKDFDIEHIIPQAKLFDDSFSNKTLEARDVNIRKSNKTAYDFVSETYGEDAIKEYGSRVEKLLKDNSISKAKRNKLLMKEADIPQGSIERDLRDTQYIAKKAKDILTEIVPHVVSTTGSVTDRLREDWQLIDLMKELNWDKYDRLGMTQIEIDKDGRRIYRINDWTKRNDHRHHAMDALTIAFTKHCYIQYLNNLNARIAKGIDDEEYIDLSDYELRDLSRSEVSKAVRAIESRMLRRDSRGRLRFIPPIPLDEFRAEAKKHLESVLVSIKSKNKVVTRNINTTKCNGSTNKEVQLTPRGQLHNETVYGRIRQYLPSYEKVGAGFTFEKIESVASKVYRNALRQRLQKFNGDPKKAFTGKNSLEKNPVYVDEMHTISIPLKVKTVTFEDIYTKREAVSKKLKIDKVIDRKVRWILEKRLENFGGDSNKAFSNLEDNPIWLNKKKGIQIKRVTIIETVKPDPIRVKRDNSGKILYSKEHEPILSDYIKTANNHHIAIYSDINGNYQEDVVTFFETVRRAVDDEPIINESLNKDIGWEFMFTMKQNEYFVFPNPETGFDPNNIDLMNPENYALISPHLFRVQKLSAKNYMFRHHLETSVNNNNDISLVSNKF